MEIKTAGQGVTEGAEAINTTRVDGMPALMEQAVLQQQQQENLSRVAPSGNVTFYTNYDQVLSFHAAALERGLSTIGRVDQNPLPSVIVGRKAMIDQEVNKELFPLLEKLIENGGGSLEQKAELLDHIVDSVYMLMGLGVNFGLPFDIGFSIVHRANMEKVIGPGRPQFFEEGNPEGEAVGKVKKPEGWVPPTKDMWELIMKAYALQVKSDPAKQTDLPADVSAKIIVPDPVSAPNPAIPAV